MDKTNEITLWLRKRYTLNDNDYLTATTNHRGNGYYELETNDYTVKVQIPTKEFNRYVNLKSQYDNLQNLSLNQEKDEPTIVCALRTMEDIEDEIETMLGKEYDVVYCWFMGEIEDKK